MFTWLHIYQKFSLPDCTHRNHSWSKIAYWSFPMETSGVLGLFIISLRNFRLNSSFLPFIVFLVFFYSRRFLSHNASSWPAFLLRRAATRAGVIMMWFPWLGDFGKRWGSVGGFCFYMVPARWVEDRKVQCFDFGSKRCWAARYISGCVGISDDCRV